MSAEACLSCDFAIQESFRFCPGCGTELGRPVRCADCSYDNEPNSKFCQECGASLAANSGRRAAASKPAAAAPTALPTPSSGLTIEFAFSTSQTFDFTVAAASKQPSFARYGEGKKALYRVTYDPGNASDMRAVVDLVALMKGWRNRTLYVDGAKSAWDSVFAFTWCYQRRQSSFKPEYYCYGYDQPYELNLWGCVQAHMPFAGNAKWFTWGRFTDRNGEWEFDKARMRHELERALYPVRYCPALDGSRIGAVLAALPDRVNPARDAKWQFVQDWSGSAVDGLVIRLRQYGELQNVTVTGVTPSGQGALQDTARKLRLQLPT